MPSQSVNDSTTEATPGNQTSPMTSSGRDRSHHEDDDPVTPESRVSRRDAAAPAACGCGRGVVVAGVTSPSAARSARLERRQGSDIDGPLPATVVSGSDEDRLLLLLDARR